MNILATMHKSEQNIIEDMLDNDFRILERKVVHDANKQIKQYKEIKKKWDRVNAKKRKNRKQIL